MQSLEAHVADTPAANDSPPPAAPVSDALRVAQLERKLAACAKVNAVLMDRLERRYESQPSFSMIEQSIALEKIVSHKTRELEDERAELRKALDDLGKTQARLLQAQKMESIGQLAAGMAHEINTPIQYVTDNVNFVRRCFDPVITAAETANALIVEAQAGTLSAERLADAQATLKRIKFDYIKRNVPAALEQSLEGLQRVASIVAAMKNFSHPSSSVKEAVDIADVIKVSTTVARNEWKYVADLALEIEPDLPPVPCLRDEVGQVILNLVVNAAHAIGEANRKSGSTAKGRLGVSVRRVDGWIEIRVQDSGTGIPEEIRGRVFDPFFTTKPVGRGTGQGLAICYSTVVDKHQGQIFFETEIGQGTTFVVRLPLAPPQDGKAPCA